MSLKDKDNRIKKHPEILKNLHHLEETPSKTVKNKK